MMEIYAQFEDANLCERFSDKLVFHKIDPWVQSYPFVDVLELDRKCQVLLDRLLELAHDGDAEI
jgi:hypothetical protein